MDAFKENAEQNGFALSLINAQIGCLDEAFLRHALDKLKWNAGMYDTTAVLNRHWSATGGAVLQAEVKCLEKLLAYIDALKECTAAKLADLKGQEAQAEMDAIFKFV